MKTKTEKNRLFHQKRETFFRNNFLLFLLKPSKLITANFTHIFANMKIHSAKSLQKSSHTGKRHKLDTCSLIDLK